MPLHDPVSHPEATDELARELVQVLGILRSRGIRYPVESRRRFVEQMRSTPDPVGFGGHTYDTEFASNLVPDFLFPFHSEEDMLAKVRELLVSRGILPLDALQEER